MVLTNGERRRYSVQERPRSGQYLTTTMAVSTRERGRDDGVEIVEARRRSLFLDDAPSRSFTYAVTGPRVSRERVVVVGESGRRRESYQPKGSI